MGRIYPPFVSGRGAVGLLVLRLVVGAAFILHGLPKIQDPMHWMDAMPAPAPGPLQAAAAVAEFGGGIALILGLLTPLFAFLIAGTMATAIQFHVGAGDPFVGRAGSYELAAVYLAIMVLLILIGPGTMSADAFLFGKKSEASP